ncbi:hypothetical protein K1719_028012 [Acacia pycnantha]|nr:hypothetical protein K1719_028012 [Acacia pycnantha]
MNTPPLHLTTTCSPPRRVNLSSTTAASSSETSYDENGTPSCQLNCPHSQQLNQISPAMVSNSAEEKGDELRLEKTREHFPVDEKLEYAKILLGFAFPMLLSLLVSPSEITKTTGARIAMIAQSFVIAFTGSCLLLRKTYPKTSTAFLICGASLTVSSVYSLVYSSLPSNLKMMILVLCGVVPFIALVLLSWAYFRRGNKMKDPEEGELIGPARIICSDGKENNTRKHYGEVEQELMEQKWKRREKEEERNRNNEFLAPGMFSLDEEAEFMKKKEIVMNIIPESVASSSSSLSSLHSRGGQQSIGHLSEGPGRRWVAIGNSVHNNLGPIQGQY